MREALGVCVLWNHATAVFGVTRRDAEMAHEPCAPERWRPTSRTPAAYRPVRAPRRSANRERSPVDLRKRSDDRTKQRWLEVGPHHNPGSSNFDRNTTGTDWHRLSCGADHKRERRPLIFTSSDPAIRRRRRQPEPPSNSPSRLSAAIQLHKEPTTIEFCELPAHASAMPSPS